MKKTWLAIGLTITAGVLGIRWLGESGKNPRGQRVPEQPAIPAASNKASDSSLQPGSVSPRSQERGLPDERVNHSLARPDAPGRFWPDAAQGASGVSWGELPRHGLWGSAGGHFPKTGFQVHAYCLMGNHFHLRCERSGSLRRNWGGWVGTRRNCGSGARVMRPSWPRRRGCGGKPR